MATPQTHDCAHCGQPSSAGRFCCGGCEMAWQVVHEAGLGTYYEHRTAPAPRPAGLAGGWASVPFETQPDGSAVVRMAVDGLRCSACTWVVEALLLRQPGVHEANVSYASGIAWLRFDPDHQTVAQLAGRVAQLGYHPRPMGAAPSRSDLLGRLGVAAFCTANLMLLSASLYAGWFEGMADRYQALFRWTALALATPVALYSAAPFFRGALQGLALAKVGMDVPIALAVAVLYGHGVLQTGMGTEGYLDSLGMLVSLLLLGRLLEQRGRRAAAEASAAIAAQLPTSARRRTPTGLETVPAASLRPGDIVEVGAGEDIPGDGVVVDGHAAVHLALLTGEAEPVAAEPGSAVVAGGQVRQGAISVEMQRVGTQTMAHRMAQAVAASTARPLPPHPSDRLAPWFTTITVGLAALGGSAWALWAGPAAGVQVAVATLVVACPCALGLSAPLAIAAGLGAAARRGVVLKDGRSLLALADAKVLALDKTGTLTEGRPKVATADDETLRLAAGLERGSAHPIATAIVDEAQQRGLAIPVPERVLELPGKGIRGRVEGRTLALASDGPGVLRLTEGPQLLGRIRLRDRLRADAADTVAMAIRAGLQPQLLSGDDPAKVAEVAHQLGIAQAEGGLQPQDKADWVAAHPQVCFVGDGLNDGPALAAADVGLAMQASVPASLLIADGVLSQPSLRPVVAAIAAAQATRETVRSNHQRALLYNTVAVAAALAGWINPLVAAVLMPLSSGWIIWSSRSVPRQMQRLEKAWTSS